MLRRALVWLAFAIPILLAAGVAWAYLRDGDESASSSETQALETRFAIRTVRAEDELGAKGDYVRSLLEEYAGSSMIDWERVRTVALDLLAWRDAEIGDSDALVELAGICEGESARRAIASSVTIVWTIHEDGTRTEATLEPEAEHPCSYARRPSPAIEGAVALIDAMDKPPKRSAYDAPAIVRAELRNLRAWSERAQRGTQSDHDYVVRVCARVKAYNFDLVASPPDRETVDLWDTLTDFCGEISTRADLALDDVTDLTAALPKA